MKQTFLFSPPGFKEAEGGLYVSIVFIYIYFNNFFLIIYLNIHRTDLYEVCRDGRTWSVDERSEVIFFDSPRTLQLQQFSVD